MTSHELEIGGGGYVEFVCPSGQTKSYYFFARTSNGMHVRLEGAEMPFAESDLIPVEGRRAANGGRLYQITADQADALNVALATKTVVLEEFSVNYLANGGPINLARD